MKLFRIVNEALNFFYVVSTDEATAQAKYEEWVVSSPEGPPAAGTAVRWVVVMAADNVEDEPTYPWATLVT